MQTNPTTLTTLDIPPFNAITLTCNVAQPQMINISKRISWVQTSPSGRVQTLTHNGIDTNITSNGLDNPTSSSTLSVYATLAGRWTFTCNASIEVPEDPVISYSQSIEVTVKGMSIGIE